MSDLMNMRFHQVKGQYDLLVKDFEERKKKEQEQETAAKTQSSSFKMPSNFPKIPSSMR